MTGVMDLMKGGLRVDLLPTRRMYGNKFTLEERPGIHRYIHIHFDGKRRRKEWSFVWREPVRRTDEPCADIDVVDPVTVYVFVSYRSTICLIAYTIILRDVGTGTFSESTGRSLGNILPVYSEPSGTRPTHSDGAQRGDTVFVGCS